MAAELGLSRAATSRQLHLMHEAGLLAMRRPYHDRRARLYAIDLQARGRIIAWLAGTEVGRPTVPEIDEPRPPTDPEPAPGPSPTPGSQAPTDARAPVDYEDAAFVDDLLAL